MAKEYISVDSSERKSGQKVDLTNRQNKFTGEFFVPIDQNNNTKNIRELFGNNGSMVFQVEFDRKSVNHSEIISKLQEQGNTVKAGDIVVVRRTFTETQGNTSKTHTAISTYTVFDSNGTLTLIPLSPSKLKDGFENEIVSTIDDDGESAFNIDDLEFDELHVNSMYIGGNDIKDVIPDLSGIRDLQEVGNPNRLQDISDKVNELIRLLKQAANARQIM